MPYYIHDGNRRRNEFLGCGRWGTSCDRFVLVAGRRKVSAIRRLFKAEGEKHVSGVVALAPS